MSKQNIYLYGGLDAKVADSYKAKEHLDALGIPYTHLFYADESQFPNILTPVNSWFTDENIAEFPFAVWDENGERKVAQGLKAIKAVNFKEPQKKTAQED